MRHLGKVESEDLVGNGLAKCYWQFHLRLLEHLARYARMHRHCLWIAVWHLDTDGSLTWYWCDDAHTRSCSNAHGNLILQVTHPADLCSRLKHYLKESDGRTNHGCDTLYLDSIVAESLTDLLFIGILLLHVDWYGLSILLEQIEGRELIVLEILGRIVRHKLLVRCFCFWSSHYYIFVMDWQFLRLFWFCNRLNRCLNLKFRLWVGCPIVGRRENLPSFDIDSLRIVQSSLCFLFFSQAFSFCFLCCLLCCGLFCFSSSLCLALCLSLKSLAAQGGKRNLEPSSKQRTGAVDGCAVVRRETQKDEQHSKNKNSARPAYISMKKLRKVIAMMTAKIDERRV